MFAISFKIEGNKGYPGASWNLDALKNDGSAYYMFEDLSPSEGEELLKVKDYPIGGPDIKKEGKIYTPYYNISEGKWYFDEQDAPPPPHDPIAELQTQLEVVMVKLEEVQKESEEATSNIYAEMRNSLSAKPAQGEEWDLTKNYMTGDTVKREGVEYISLKLNRNKDPKEHPELWEPKKVEAQHLKWEDDPESFNYKENDIREHKDQIWICTFDHFKVKMYEPKDGSSRWKLYGQDDIKVAAKG